MDHKNLLKTGIAGSLLAGLCCFTPALVLLFSAFGVSAWLAWADFVLLPALALSLALIGYAIYRRRAAARQG